MRFELEIPDPSSLRIGNPKFVMTEPELILHRIHLKRFGPTAFNDSDAGSARFSPIRDKAGNIIPTIYGADCFECAAAEIILRSPDTPIGSSAGKPHIVAPADHSNRVHSEIRVKPAMKLLDLTVEGQRCIGVERNALIAGPRSTYPGTRAWAEASRAAFKDIQGLYYLSHQLSPRWAVVLFGDRLEPDDLEEISSRDISSTPCHDEIEELASRLGIDYFDI